MLQRSNAAVQVKAGRRSGWIHVQRTKRADAAPQL